MRRIWARRGARAKRPTLAHVLPKRTVLAEQPKCSNRRRPRRSRPRRRASWSCRCRIQWPAGVTQPACSARPTSILFTTSMPDTTLPKTTCLLSSLATITLAARGSARAPVGDGGAEEELGAVGVAAGVGHGERAGPGVLEIEVLVLERAAVDRLACPQSCTKYFACIPHRLCRCVP